MHTHIQTTYFPEHIPGYWQGVHPAVTCQSASGAPWYRVISRFTGTEQEPEDIPSWVSECLCVFVCVCACKVCVVKNMLDVYVCVCVSNVLKDRLWR